jgi:ATP-dependent helicase HrpA
VDELWRDVHHSGDILVFLPGEREIREAADHLRGHLSHQPLFRGAEVLPLFARLSQAEQDRIFDAHNGRRIVLATNVAETSLTVPGIKYVIDAGTARMKRYSFRSKVEQLLVEPISQAAANQRAGRCGRVANGICIRLYDEKDFLSRPPFTDPEILRSSLAGVILRMKSLHLGVVEDFPFLEKPSGRAIADGYQLLGELGAVDDANALTPMGAELAKLPLDPRVGRMILEARTRQALDEVLVIASALSVQDVRDRPMDAQQQADQAHAKFDDEKSEFSGYLKLWKWIEAQLAGGAAGQVDQGQQVANPRLSNRQYEQLLRKNFISLRRVTGVARHSQSTAHGGGRTQMAHQHAHPPVTSSCTGHVGGFVGQHRVQTGVRHRQWRLPGCAQHQVLPAPGAHLIKKPGRWIVAAELVETTRLFGRGIAAIEPQWLEQVGAHLLKKQLLDPHWEKKAGGGQRTGARHLVRHRHLQWATSQLQPGRLCPARVRFSFARRWLVANGRQACRFLAANQKLIQQVEDLEHKARQAGCAGRR